MPIYAYRCSQCGHAQDILRKISDPPLTLCPACGNQALVKQVTAAGFALKGTGWYVTDFRGSGNGANSGIASAPASAGGDANATPASTGAAAGASTAASSNTGASTNANTTNTTPTPSTSASTSANVSTPTVKTGNV